MSTGRATAQTLPGRASAELAPPANEATHGAGATPFEPPEKFLPITKSALMDRLIKPERWPGVAPADVRRLFRYLDYWRQQTYTQRLLEIQDAYEPFSPDSDLLITRDYTPVEKVRLQNRVISGLEQILQQANFKRIAPEQVELILTRESHYGLDLSVDLSVFEEVLIYYRGMSSKKDWRRKLLKFGRKEEFEVPIYQRLCIAFKLKPIEVRITEVMDAKKCSRKDAEKFVAKLRAHLPAEVKEGLIYMKLFKNIPRTDIEMVFPNTQVRFRMMDKLRLGGMAGGGLGFGVFSAAGKVALVATNPLAAAGAALGIGGVAFRQAMAFVNQKQKYMVVMARNLYFHSMADNRGVIVKLASRASEEDTKEEWLLYSVLAKVPASRADLPEIDKAIEQHMLAEFGVTVDFDIEDALERLKADGIVTESADGMLTTLPPREAALHIDAKWDIFLDELPDPGASLGHERDA
jgi:Protein of unknown function (DUF3754)